MGIKANYTIIGAKKKAKIEINFETVPEIKKAILKVMLDNKKFWEDKNQIQLGIEKFNILKKVCALEPTTTSKVFEHILTELEQEQIILPIIEGNIIRFIYFEIKVEDES